MTYNPPDDTWTVEPDGDHWRAQEWHPNTGSRLNGQLFVTREDAEYYADRRRGCGGYEGAMASLREHQLETNTAHEEWEVTGDPGHGFPPYRFVFSHHVTDINPSYGATPEEAARRFVERSAKDWPWVQLRRRTITTTPWQEIKP